VSHSNQLCARTGYNANDTLNQKNTAAMQGQKHNGTVPPGKGMQVALRQILSAEGSHKKKDSCLNRLWMQ
jgi:hypothetical protein